MQIKGYPVRLPLDVMLVFTANPEDYTARGKIITPLKDRIGSEIRTHYPATLEHGIAITEAGSLDEAAVAGRSAKSRLTSAKSWSSWRFLAREDKRVDKRSGVSQRLPISVLENVISNAERRRFANRRRRGGAARPGYLCGAALDHRQARTGIRRRAEGRRRGGARTDSHGRRQGLQLAISKA